MASSGHSGPCPGPRWASEGSPIFCSGEGRNGPTRKVFLKNVLLDSLSPETAEHLHPHHFISDFSEVRFPLEPKQSEQLNARSRKELKKWLSHCCTEQFHFPRSLTGCPLRSPPRPAPACRWPLGAQPVASLGGRPSETSLRGICPLPALWVDGVSGTWRGGEQGSQLVGEVGGVEGCVCTGMRHSWERNLLSSFSLLLTSGNGGRTRKPARRWESPAEMDWGWGGGGDWNSEGKDEREWTERGPRCMAKSAQRKQV